MTNTRTKKQVVTKRSKRPIGIPEGLIPLYEGSHERGREALRQAIGIARRYLLTCKEQYPDHYPDEVTIENLTEEDLALIQDISQAIYDAWLQRRY